MITELQISVSPEVALNPDLLRYTVAGKMGISTGLLNDVVILRRSIDARSRQPKYILKLKVVSNEPNYKSEIKSFKKEYKEVEGDKHVVIIGAGPAGLFAALKLIELGVKPIIVERGKPVKERRRDLAAITKHHIVNNDSNYCFGEGGAGTYSDGKLYTRSTKRGDIINILESFVAHGAGEEILVDAHPHIGTNKLPHIIENIRETILNAGGEIHFQQRMIDIIIVSNAVRSIVIKNTETDEITEIATNSVILATGHSARDIFELLHSKNILIEAKQFAMGVRIEHPQSYIDSVQYHCKERGPYLPPAAYSLVTQAEGKGVYSFCMCPGGIIAPCATSPGEVVTNGWSPSKRNNPFANSGFVVEVKPSDYEKYKTFGPLAGLKLQQELEHVAWKAGGETQTAPAQRAIDFVNNRISSSLPECSYIPGIVSAPLHTLLPPDFAKPMQIALREFDKKMKGYLMNDALLVGFETRTSSPVRIPRDNETLQHIEIKGLYPCGEGAGYAGGIISAAIDGQRCAEASASLEL